MEGNNYKKGTKERLESNNKGKMMKHEKKQDMRKRNIQKRKEVKKSRGTI